MYFAAACHIPNRNAIRLSQLAVAQATTYEYSILYVYKAVAS